MRQPESQPTSKPDKTSTIDSSAEQNYSRLNKQEIKVLLPVAGVYMTRMLGLFMLLPVFAVYAAGLDNISPIMVGLAIGIYGLAQASLQIPLGALSDRIGRKAVIVGGLLVFLLGSVIAGLSDNIYLIIFGRFLQGAGAIASAIMALVSDITREQVRSKAMAVVGASIGAAFLLSLILGPLLFAQFGMSGVFYTSAMLAAISILLIALFVPSKAVQIQPTLPVEKTRLKALIFDKNLRSINFGVFVLHWILTSAFLVLPIVMTQQLALPIEKHAWFYLIIFFVSFCIMWPLLKYVDQNFALRSTLLIFLMAFVQFLLAIFLDSINLIFFVIFIIWFFVAFNSLEATMPSQLSKQIDPTIKGTAMGVYSTSQFMGAFLGAFINGIVMQFADWQSVFLLNTCLCSIWLIINASSLKSSEFVEEPPENKNLRG